MSIDRRKVIGLFAASAATTLAGCGGGGDDGPGLQRVWVMNINPEFPTADVSVGSTLIATGLPFPGGLTSPLDFDTGSYTVRVQRSAGGSFYNFDNVVIDARSPLPSLFVFYRRFASARLGSAPRGIENYFDSSVNLDVDLFDGDGTGNSFAQTETLAFQGDPVIKSGTSQVSRSSTCRLRLFAEGSSTLIYDSGVQNRAGSILIHPRFPADSQGSGEVAVVALNYGFANASAVIWPNLLASGLSLPAVSGTPDPRVRGVRGT